MTRDPFDDLLERSAPATRRATASDLEAMITAARTAGVTRQRRVRRTALASGVLAVLLVGGAGVATATDGFRWAPWAEDPVGAVSFAMSNGFDCELRFSEYGGGSDAAFLAGANRALGEWYRTADIVAEAQGRIPQKQAFLASLVTSEQQAELDAQLAQLSEQERADALAHNAFAAEWMAWEHVVGDLESEALRQAGIQPDDARFAGSERGAQIQCYEPDGQPYGFGAGS